MKRGNTIDTHEKDTMKPIYKFVKKFLKRDSEWGDKKE
jgi:hypothetical protein